MLRGGFYRIIPPLGRIIPTGRFTIDVSIIKLTTQYVGTAPHRGGFGLRFIKPLGGVG